jgi:hypothetical protein
VRWLDVVEWDATTTGVGTDLEVVAAASPAYDFVLKPVSSKIWVSPCTM